jgi:DNA-directed RNA polymerase subunit RPC12/RpoP
VAVAPISTNQAWLALAVGDNRQHGGNDGYSDNPSVHYLWDDTVPNHGKVRAGDAIILWDKNLLLGVSVIEHIDVAQSTKRLYKCPECGLAGIKARKIRSPGYKCYKCKSEFDEASVSTRSVTIYRSHHGQRWLTLDGALTGAELRALCDHPKSQLSLRPVRWRDFLAALDQAADVPVRRILEGARDRLAGGHEFRTVRVRLGQGRFRQTLLDRYGPTCAFTGECPEAALDAAHLYSYAARGQHHDDGGLLLRRDTHRLFDTGLLAIDLQKEAIDVDVRLRPYAEYWRLQDRPVQVALSDRQRGWLRAHWTMHRGDV